MPNEPAACEPFEIAVLQQVRGALEPTAAKDLEEHLRACASCRRFQSMAIATDAALRGSPTEAGDLARTGEQMQQALQRRLRDDRTRVMRTLFAVVAIVVLSAWWRGVGTALVIGGIGLAMGVVGLAATVFAPHRRMVAAAVTGHGDLLAWLRDDLDARIAARRRLRPVRVIMTVLALLLLVSVGWHLAQDLWLEPQPLDAKTYVVPLTIVALTGWSLLRDAHENLSRLERQRQELS